MGSLYLHLVSGQLLNVSQFSSYQMVGQKTSWGGELSHIHCLDHAVFLEYLLAIILSY